MFRGIYRGKQKHEGMKISNFCLGDWKSSCENLYAFICFIDDFNLIIDRALNIGVEKVGRVSLIFL